MKVTCCCCQKEALFEEVQDLWFPAVFHENEYLGDLCNICATKVGIRDSKESEQFHNSRIENYETYLSIKGQVP